jgi:hypothetical protein
LENYTKFGIGYLANTENFNPFRQGISMKLYFKSGEEGRSLGIVVRAFSRKM